MMCLAKNENKLTSLFCLFVAYVAGNNSPGSGTHGQEGSRGRTA